jgi:calcineurin-like phosphoesterase family protein
MRRKLGLLLLASIAVAQYPKAAGPTFRLENKDLSSPPVFVVYGDMRFTTWRFTKGVTSGWARRALVQKIATEEPDAVFLSGDVPFRGAYWSDYEVFEKETHFWRERHLRLYPVLGNHEFYNRDLLVRREQGLANWWKEFPTLKGLQWYSVQLGEQIYVLCLDSNFVALKPGGPQRVWLEQQLSGAVNSFSYVFIVLHHARAGDFLEGSASDYESRENEDGLESYLEHLQQRAQARIVVVAGHDHNYGRMERNGVVYIVSGGGGAHPVFFRRQPEDRFKGKDLLAGGKPLPNYNYLKFVLGPGGLKSTMFRISNPAAGEGEASWDSPDVFVITPYKKIQ